MDPNKVKASVHA